VTPEKTRTWFEEFCRREYVAVYRYVSAHTGNVEDAREVVQESFLGFHQMLLAGEIREHDRALLFRIARNKAIDLVRRHARQKKSTRELRTGKVLTFKPPEQRTPEELLLEKERRQFAEEALARLSDRDQECLALRRSGLTNQQVAETLNVSAVAVRQIISRALRRFEQFYEQLLGQTANDPLSDKANGQTNGKTGRS